MTREEFESILEEAYIEGYNSALEDVQEDILDEEAFDLERDYDYYTEESGHHRNITRQFSLGGLKHARSTDMGRHFAKIGKKEGIPITNSKEFKDQLVNNNDKLKEKIDNLHKRIQQSKKYKAFEKYANKNMERFAKQSEDDYDKFKQGKLKDLKKRIALNTVRNARRKFGLDD